MKKILILLSFVAVFSCGKNGYDDLRVQNKVGQSVGQSDKQMTFLCDTLTGEQVRVTELKASNRYEKFVDGDWVIVSSDNVGYCRNSDDFESACYAYAGDTLSGYIKFSTASKGEILKVYDLQGNEVVGAVAVDSKYCGGTPPSDIITVCLCDDINGDSTVLNSYVEAYSRSIENGVVQSLFLGTFLNATLDSAYVVANPVDCDLGAEDAEIVWERVVLENGIFTSDPLTTALSYSIETIGDGVTIDDGTKSFPVYEGERGHWGNDDYNIFSNTITIAATNSVVVIIYKKLN